MPIAVGTGWHIYLVSVIHLSFLVRRLEKDFLNVVNTFKFIGTIDCHR